VYELEVRVSKVMGTCTADPPMKPGDSFTVANGDIRIPEGGYICMWALQNMLPVIALKERALNEKPEEDWVWRVHHVQCPDPAGRVIFRITRKQQLDLDRPTDAHVSNPSPFAQEPMPALEASTLQSLRVVVEEVRGKCTSGMRPGDAFILRSGRLYIPAGGHFCLYALQAVLPMLPAKQRLLQDGDWLKDVQHVICPDPAGNVVLRIEPYGSVPSGG
jgi:uncharacterized repeat protein (TIGR04076 family)